jgi:S-DNA-T family DNA segregation ATPase FtsK/SpoIIIE
VRCLAELRRRHAGLDVVIEGAETLLDSPVEPVLRQHSAAAGPHGGLVVAGACTTDLASQFRGFAVELARHRTGVLLGPGGPGAGDVFGLRLPRDGATPPGRGLLVSRDGLVPFQVAQPEGVVDRTP